ncbi:MAG TPA: modulator protein, partial [Alphaproteobacteria bacterium]|nr:modulator protein [Alphaproteobacteria bacterium]
MSQVTDAPDPARLQSIADELVALARKGGADAAEAAVIESRSTEVSLRDGKLEDIERSESRDAGLRVLLGKRQAGVSFSDLSSDGLQTVVERAIAMARLAPEDPHCGLAEPGQLTRNAPEIALYEDAEWSPETLEVLAADAEKAGRDVDGVTMTESASASHGSAAGAVSASNGFAGGWRRSSMGYGAVMIAARDGAMERDYSYSQARRTADLRSPEDIGREAGERAVARLAPRKLASGRLPVVFDRRISTVFLSSLSGAISGPSVARGVSFLRDKRGEKVFADGIRVIDNPLRDWGMGSRPWDGEGLAVKEWAVIDDGVLTDWFLNLPAARQLGLEPNGCGTRNLGGPPGAGPSNLHLEAGSASPEDL